MKLKPCPFCGSTEINLDPGSPGYGYPSINCQNCEAEGPYIESEDEDVLRDAWNNRYKEE